MNNVSFTRKTECSEYCSSRPSVGAWVPPFYSKIDGDTFPASNFTQSKVHTVVIVSSLKFPILSLEGNFQIGFLVFYSFLNIGVDG